MSKFKKKTRIILNTDLNNLEDKELQKNMDDFENWKKNKQLFELKGEYPEQVITYKFLEPDMNVLELGANIGRNTQIIANIIKQGKVLAVEMNKSNETYLKKISDKHDNLSIFIGAISEVPLYFNGKSWRTSYNGKIKVNTISITNAKKQFFNWDVIIADCEGCITKLCENEDFLKNVKMIILENDFNCCKNRVEFENKMNINCFKEIFTLNKGNKIIQGVPQQNWKHGDKTQTSFISVWKK